MKNRGVSVGNVDHEYCGGVVISVGVVRNYEYQWGIYEYQWGIKKVRKCECGFVKSGVTNGGGLVVGLLTLCTQFVTDTHTSFNLLTHWDCLDNLWGLCALWCFDNYLRLGTV